MKQKGFTIVELLIVIVVIGILAAITIVAYNGIQQRAAVAQLTSAVTQGGKALKIYQADIGSYPADLNHVNNGQGLPPSNGVSYRYTATGTTFCLTATNDARFFMMTESTAPEEGSCVNVARGASATSAILTDGITTSTPYYSTNALGVPETVTVDLGSVKMISLIKVWHYYTDSRKYKDVLVQVSIDNSAWQTIFDGVASGQYTETSAGMAHNFSARSVRYIRERINGSTSNAANHWVEIQAY